MCVVRFSPDFPLILGMLVSIFVGINGQEGLQRTCSFVNWDRSRNSNMAKKCHCVLVNGFFPKGNMLRLVGPFVGNPQRIPFVRLDHSQIT